MDDLTQTTRFRFWLWLIRVIGVIVPRRLRSGWRQEWEAELRYREELLTEWDKLHWRAKLALLWHSAGAFMDALWLQPKRLEDEMFQDLRYGVRLMSQNPGFTLIAVFTLALGIGANTTVFSLADACMLRPFNFPNQDRLVMIWEKGQAGFARGFVAPGNFNDFLEQSQSFERLVAIEEQDFDLTGKDFSRAARMAVPLLMGMVGFVLLVACANVANMLLSRAVNRQKEIAVRLALGASRLRLVRQLMTESLLLALAGGGLGLLLSVWGVKQFRASVPEDFTRFVPGIDHLGVNQTTLLFTLLVSMMTVALFGLLPALQASKPSLNESLKEGARGASFAGSRRRLRGALVVAEIAIALVLLIGAGLMLRSFVVMAREDIGFDPRNALGFWIGLSEEKYTEEKRRIFFDQLLNRLRTLPGVAAAGAIHVLPMTGGSRADFAIIGEPPAEKGKEPVTNFRIVTPGYFGAIGMPLKRGRDFNAQDNEKAAGVAIVDEAFARWRFPNQDPIGRRIIFLDKPDKPLEIVGVVGNVKNKLDEIAEPYIYAAYAHFPFSGMGIVVRTAAEPTAITPALRGEVMALDPALPISGLKTAEQIVFERTTPKRIITAMMSVFAVFALLMAGAGLYAVMAYAVSRRTREIGVRLALGARPRDILMMITRQGMKLTLAGLAFGLAGAFALTRVMSRILFGVSAVDPLTFALVSLLFIGVALLACWIPARRATQVDPMIALRCE